MDTLDSTTVPQKTLASRAVMAGLLSAGVTSLLGLLVYVTGMNETLMTNKPLSWLNNLLTLGIMFYFVNAAVRMFRDQDNSGYVSVGQGIGLGTLAGLVAGIVSAVWSYIFMTFIAPDMIETIKQVSMQQMQESGQSEEQIDQAMEMAGMFFSPAFVAAMIVFFLLFIGFIAGLISGFMQKRERPYA